MSARLQDAFFGLLSTLIKTAHEDLQTPMDVVKFLHHRLASMFEETAGGRRGELD